MPLKFIAVSSRPKVFSLVRDHLQRVGIVMRGRARALRVSAPYGSILGIRRVFLRYQVGRSFVAPCCVTLVCGWTLVHVLLDRLLVGVMLHVLLLWMLVAIGLMVGRVCINGTLHCLVRIGSCRV